MTERTTKYVTIPIQTDEWEPSIFGGLRPVFDQITLTWEEYDQLVAQGGMQALRDWVLDRRNRTAIH